MRGKLMRLFGLTLALLLVLVAGSSMAQAPAPQPKSIQQTLAGNAFTYQGYLTDGGSPANGLYDFAFSLYADAGGTQWVASAASVQDHLVVDGLFTVQVDLTDPMWGDVYFYLNGDARWLRIGVRPGGSTGAYTYLSPLQPLTPAPYALALPGLNTIQNGTSANVVGGYSWNYVDPNVVGATIGGGGHNGGRNEVYGDYATVGGGRINDARQDDDTVGGGASNTADGGDATVGGGEGNTAGGACATVAGGCGNVATGVQATVGGGGVNYAYGESATVGGGSGNSASGNHATVGGGYTNYATNLDATIAGGIYNSASGESSTVAGGSNNTASGICATAAAGCNNTASGDWSFAAGRHAKADDTGAFVWADSTGGDFYSGKSDEVRFRATNGLYLWSDNSLYGLRIDHNDTASNGDGIDVFANVSYGTFWAAVYAINSGTSPAVYANTAGTYSGYFQDNIYVAGDCIGCSLVYVGLNGGSQPLESGDLVAVGGMASPLLGDTAPIMRVRRTEPGSTDAVVGVVQGRAQIVESTKDGEHLESAEKADGAAAPGDYLFIVVQGMAQVKADASAGPIVAGQRLTAGDRPGHVRVLQTRTLEGMVVTEGVPVVGIALDTVDPGTGLVPVLVTLR